MTQLLYQAGASSTTNPDQVRISGDPELVMQVSAPAALGGNADTVDPEQLYAAALASCLHQAVVIVGTAAGVDTSDTVVRAEVALEHDGHIRYSFHPTVSIELPSCPASRYDEIVEAAMSACPMAGPLTVTLNTAPPTDEGLDDPSPPRGRADTDRPHDSTDA